MHRSVESVGLHKSCAICGDFVSDIHFVGEQHGRTARHCFGNSNSEVLLMRWQDESFGAIEGAPLCIAGGHAGPMDAVCDSSVCSGLPQFGAPLLLIRTSHHQIEFRIVGSDFSKGIDQKVASLLSMDSSQEKKVALVSHLWALFKEDVLHRLQIAGGTLGTIRNDVRIPAMQPEALFGESFFGFRGEEHAICPA